MMLWEQWEHKFNKSSRNFTNNIMREVTWKKERKKTRWKSFKCKFNWVNPNTLLMLHLYYNYNTYIFETKLIFGVTLVILVHHRS